jgi:imidazolonepropionase-like amidohydrolase
MPQQTVIAGGRLLRPDATGTTDETVLIEDGRIEAVGMRLAGGSGAQVIDATGLWVVPGFVEPHAHVGVHEESSGLAGDDTNETTGPNQAGLRALDGINIEDPGFRDALTSGITTVIVKPGSSNAFGGQCVAVKTGGGPTVDSRVIHPSISMKTALGENPKSTYGAKGMAPSTRMGLARIIRQCLTDAREGPAGDSLDTAALRRLLDGELLWDVHAHRHDDIATAMRLAAEFGLRLVINHGTEAYKLVDELRARDLPIVLGPIFAARTKVELAGHRNTSAAVLDAAGIPVALTTDHPEVPLHLLVQQAAFAHREGMPRDAALRAISSVPAAIYGLEGRVGSIAPGRDADLALWTGDPLDAQSRVELVLIEGQVVYRREEAA